jgi:hypothetical protein
MIMYHRYLVITLAFILAPLAQLAQSHAHGGIPGVIELYPPQDSTSDTFWMIDTLGLFRGDAGSMISERIDARSWSWLCDDAVDPTLGVDALLVIDPQTLIAVARSGVYRSVDRGCSFYRLVSPINEHAIGGVSAHAEDSSQLTIFTNSIGRENRVWWSEDKGETWTPSDLLVEGGIFGLWRDPDSPDEVWVNHAQGLSRSRDGGRSFESINDVNYSGASPYEVRLLGGGYLGGRLVLWASLDHYPTSSLMISTDEGQNWQEVHRVNDSYDQLAMTPEALWVSTPFEGLFVYPITDVERRGDEGSWSGFWRQHSATFVSCLTPDPLEPGALWACGRSEPTGWLVGRSTDLGETWSVSMTSYQDAAEGDWGCAPESPSLAACSTRCLGEGCDPSLNMPITGGEEVMAGEMVTHEMMAGEMTSVETGAGSTNTGSGVDQDQSTTRPHQDSSCQSLFGSALSLPYLLLLLLVIFGGRLRQPRSDSGADSHS